MKHFKKCAFLKYKCIFCNKDIFQINVRKHFSSSCKLLINRDDDEKITYIGYHDDNFNSQGFCKELNDNGINFLGEFKKRKIIVLEYYFQEKKNYTKVNGKIVKKKE